MPGSTCSEGSLLTVSPAVESLRERTAHSPRTQLGVCGVLAPVCDLCSELSRQGAAGPCAPCAPGTVAWAGRSRCVSDLHRASSEKRVVRVADPAGCLWTRNLPSGKQRSLLQGEWARACWLVPYQTPRSLNVLLYPCAGRWVVGTRPCPVHVAGILHCRF